MCGICGVYRPDGKKIAADLLHEMSETLKHRGPDDEGGFLAPGIALGHRRLSIIDLRTGRQPLCNEDESIQLVCNGEIYNHQRLREELGGKGHRFRSKSDSEVIIHLYEERGVGLLEKLRGMFAFALWDGKRRCLLLARDRLGQKPLYYARRGQTLIFASEIKAILRHPGVQARVNLQAVHDFLCYQYVPSPQTAFSDIYKLPPASYLLQCGARVKLERYWHLSFEPKVALGEAQCRRRLQELLEEAVRIRLMSDVPLGAFLSGGLDSSTVVALMSKLCERPVKTFSIGFEEDEYNELSYARLVARRFHTDHQEFMVTPSALEILPDLIWHYNEPFADPSALPTYYVSRVSRRHVTVALCGDAGDENFAGYERYLMHRWARSYRRLPRVLREKVIGKLAERLERLFPRHPLARRLRNLVKRISLPSPELHAQQMRIFSPELSAQLYSPELARAARDDFLLELFAQARAGDELDRLLWVDIHSYLPDDLLVKVDVASMANSLEVRSPFLDHELVEFVAALPPGLKLRGGEQKYLLKRAFADLLPPAVLRRRKMGFSVPLDRWFRGCLKDYLREVLLDERTLKRGYFRPGPLRELLREHESGKFDHGFKLWSLLILELWQRMFIDGDGL